LLSHAPVRVCGSQGCAAGYGYCASSHLDIVLEKMTAVVNTDMKKKSGGFLGLMSDKSDGDIDKMKCTAFLCYGYAAAKADVRHACPLHVHAYTHTCIRGRLTPDGSLTALSSRALTSTF
jgi:hypothetical protein